MTITVSVSAAVEGIVDEAVARKLIAAAGGRPGPIYGKNGKPALREKISGYNHAARHAPWFVLVDLNGDADCAVPFCKSWLPAPQRELCFRVAVRQVEAWLIADPAALAAYLTVARGRIPANPENLSNAKTAMVNLARQSRHKAIQQDMVPREGSGRAVGPAYSSRLIEYVESRWRPDVAAHHADSLRRAINCLERLVSAWREPERQR